MSSALIVVDMQRDLCWDERRRDKVTEAIPKVQKLVAACADANALVVYSYFALRPDDPQFDRFGDRYCVEGTEGAELIPEMFPLRGPLLRKRKHSVFFDTGLDDMLRGRGVQTVYFAGLQTQICIMTSMADASFRGYHGVCVRECVISTRDSAKDSALDWIARYVGEVAALDDVVAELGNER